MNSYKGNDEPCSVEFKGHISHPWEWLKKVGTHEHPGNSDYVETDVHLAGSASVGIRNGRPLLDTAYFGRWDLWERNKPYWNEAVGRLAEAPERVDEAVSLNTVWSGNYFHWVLDLLPRLLYMLDRDMEIPYIILPSYNPRFVYESLELLELDSKILHASRHMYVGKLRVVNCNRYEGVIHPMNLSRLWRYFILDRIGFWGSDVFSPFQLFISRQDAETRRVVNRDQVKEILPNLKDYTPGHRSFRDQILRFHQASHIIAPHGAGLVNMLWMKPGTVVELYPQMYTNPCLWMLGNQLGHIYYGVESSAVLPNEDIEADLDKIRRLNVNEVI